MFTEKDIRPIPKYILEKIKKLDKNIYNLYDGVRFYSYLGRIKNELVRITVACKLYKKQWFCKQVAVHGVHSENCLIKDIEYCLMGYTVGWYDRALSNTKRRCDDTHWCKAEDKYYNPFCPIINKKYALKFKEFKYSVADKYPYHDFLEYLRIYEQYPKVEYFMKAGLYHLATSKTIIKKATKDKNFVKWLNQYTKEIKNEDGNYPYFSAQTMLLAYKENLPLMEALQLHRQKQEIENDYYYKEYLGKSIKRSETITLIKYLNKQKISIRQYEDYFKACEFLKLDMNLEKNKYPHKFTKWHDIRTDQYATAKALADQKEKQELYKKFESVAKKYISLQRDMEEDLIVIIAKSPAELIKEGEKLHHCVGRMNYDQKFVKEKSLIFFIRAKDRPNKPFITLEYSLENHKILQCYGNYNSRPDEKTLEFINKTWLPYANRKIKKIA